MAKVLIIDDNQPTCEALAELVRNIGHEGSYALSLADGLNRALGGDFDVVFLDVRMPDGNGLDILPRLKALPMPPEVIIMTGLGDPDGAELAIRNGAWDYLQKPLSPKKILLPLTRVLKYRDNLRELTTPPPMKRCGIVGHSAAIRATMDRLAVAARGNANVLITGETGTGKELFARALHENSARADRPFVVVDCAAIPANLLESTLFGHVRGAFTGADAPRTGLVKEADGGTLFLDEVGELSPDLQKKFLRVLQEKRFRPVGAQHELTSDFRLVAATNRDLEDMSRRGEFREDLLYRLCSVAIHLPPLRERAEDIDELAQELAARISRKNGIAPKTFAPDFIDTLRAYGWPGNIRELSNTLESAIVGAYFEPELFATHLPERIRISTLKSAIADASAVTPNAAAPCPNETGNRDGLVYGFDTRPEHFPEYKDFRNDVLDAADREYFTRLMEAADWKVSRACDLSGLGKSRLYVQLRKYGIDR
ncbi:two-component system NtrC family response regulator [Desulfobaculum xiamenense]|uniref:Two-component system NtrC family response regulator n=1 Tax=Desulfobaculum xiamenense TaxID=995050 RepID=A0A846QQT2_9BACT|nr:sigma-54 dependent transcriptional regulator [Desulfobaculum xiamenense]NJB67564.1 two-component system NtrC family response regulator [Desulfobaculum xiamenense]